MLYAAMDVSDSDRHYFYKHMGHSEGINQHIYQAPLTGAEILKVGSWLMAMDGTVPRVDTHCGTVTRDDVERDNAELGAMESDRFHATESDAYVTGLAECEVSSSQLQSFVSSEDVSHKQPSRRSCQSYFDI